MRLSASAAAPVVLVEEHGGALAVWQRQRVRGATVVTLDAHLDLRPIAPRWLATLRACANDEEFAALEKPVCWMSNDGHAYDLENFLYAAWSLGIAARIVQVSQSPIDGGAVIEALTTMAGAGPLDLEGLARRGATLDASFYGVPVVLADLDALASLSSPTGVVLDIDLDFFIRDEEPWIEVEDVIRRLEPLRIGAALLTVARSVQSGFHPLRYRHFAEHLVAWWTGDDARRGHYIRLAEIDRRARRGEPVAAALADEARAAPDCPATRLLLAHCDSDRRAVHMAAAAALDPAYTPNAARDCAELVNRRVEASASRLAELADRLATEPLTRDARGWGHLALALVHLRREELAAGRHHYLAARSRVGRSGLLGLPLGELLLRQGQARRARVVLSLALADERTRARAALILGNLAAQEGRLDDAERLLSVASDAFGLWARPAEVLSQVREALGDDAGAQAAAARVRAIHAAITRAEARLEEPP